MAIDSRRSDTSPTGIRVSISSVAPPAAAARPCADRGGCGRARPRSCRSCSSGVRPLAGRAISSGTLSRTIAANCAENLPWLATHPDTNNGPAAISARSACIRSSRHSCSIPEPSAAGTCSLQPPWSVSTTRCPRRASSASAVDFPTPDIPVIRTAATAAAYPGAGAISDRFGCPAQLRRRGERMPGPPVGARQSTRSSSSAMGQAPSVQLEITVRVVPGPGSCMLQNDTPAS